MDHISARRHFPVPLATRLCGAIWMNGQHAKMGSRNISPHPEHLHAKTMPPSRLNATRCSTPTVYGVRLGLNTPTDMSLYATNSVILGKCKEGSNKFLLALSITLPRGFPAIDLRRSSTTMGCLTGKGDGIQCRHPEQFDGPHGPVELTFHRQANKGQHGTNLVESLPSRDSGRGQSA